MIAFSLPFSAEMERFELSRRLPDLPHFECGPFSHLGTSPYDNELIIYKKKGKVNLFFAGKKLDNRALSYKIERVEIFL